MAKGFFSTVQNPGTNERMLWLRDVALPYSGDECLVWPFGREPTGYCSMGRHGKKFYVHRHVCELVHGAPPTPKHHAAHSCNNGPGGCVSPRHLSWKTNAENQHDRFRSQPVNVRYKLLPAQVEEIRALRGKEPVQVTASRFGISVTYTKDIQSGKARSLRTQTNFFSVPEIQAIRAAKGTAREIARRYGGSIDAITNIRNGTTYKYIPFAGKPGDAA
jgi:hypothetical protein